MSANGIQTHADGAGDGTGASVGVGDLLQTRLFAGEDAEVIDWLLDACYVRELRAGETLFVPGQKNNLLYLVLQGELMVKLEGESQDLLDQINAGDCIGEMSVLEGMPASAFVIAICDTRLFVIKDVYVWSLINRSHVIARNLLLTLSARIRKGQKILSKSYQLQRTFEQDSKIDCLTGLYNRRWLKESLPRLAQRDRKLSLLILDIDYFKKLNDLHGHLTGDVVLSSVAQTLLQQLRPTDMAVRYGGEEFLAILPDTDIDEAHEVADRVRRTVSAARMSDVEEISGPSVTVSIGVSQLMPGQDDTAMLACADAALYRAKHAGRNCVSR